MKKFIIVWLAVGIVLSCAILSYAGGSKEKDAQEMVKKAIAYIKEVGREKAFSEISNKKGRFTTEDTYVFVNKLDGTVLAHGQFPQWVGKNHMDIKDDNQTKFVKLMIDLVKKNDSGWVSYDFMNPVTKNVQKKHTYVEKYKDVVVGCGYYQ